MVKKLDYNEIKPPIGKIIRKYRPMSLSETLLCDALKIIVVLIRKQSLQQS